MCMVMYMFGVVGFMGGGLNDMILFNWVFYAQNHVELIFIHIAIGLIFATINFFVFRYVIIKFNIMTPGRNKDEGDIKLYTKKDYKNKNANPDKIKALAILAGVGGASNVDVISNCQTRLRLVIHDPALVEGDSELKQAGALGIIRSGKNLQIVIGLSVSVVREYFEAEVVEQRTQMKNMSHTAGESIKAQPL